MAKIGCFDQINQKYTTKTHLKNFDRNRTLLVWYILIILCSLQQQVDILVNNSGRSQRALAIDTELKVDQDLFEINVIGSISLTKAVLPHMVNRKAGHIVVVSSVQGKFGRLTLIKAEFDDRTLTTETLTTETLTTETLTTETLTTETLTTETLTTETLTTETLTTENLTTETSMTETLTTETSMTETLTTETLMTETLMTETLMTETLTTETLMTETLTT